MRWSRRDAFVDAMKRCVRSHFEAGADKGGFMRKGAEVWLRSRLALAKAGDLTQPKKVSGFVEIQFDQRSLRSAWFDLA